MSRGLPQKVKLLLNKALDTAILAVENYNKPAIKFKSGSYIVLMCIAWTSLFHAIFLKNKELPYYKENNNKRYKRVNGEYQFWELQHCVKHYFKGNENAIVKNLELFIPLRNKIEHKFLPELDANLFAECQSLLMNFDKIVQKEFGEQYCLRESLSFSLQLFPSTQTLNACIKENSDADKIRKFIETYRNSISPEILKSGEYSFKAFLFQVANHKSKDALPIQFVSYDSLCIEERAEIEKFVTLIKEKRIPVANQGKLKPNTVVQLVQSGLGDPKVKKGDNERDKFTLSMHTQCWKKYGVRPENNSDKPEQTQSKYCVYDEPNKSYLYTEEWVNFLIEKMSDEEEFQRVYKNKKLVLSNH